MAEFSFKLILLSLTLPVTLAQIIWKNWALKKGESILQF